MKKVIRIDLWVVIVLTALVLKLDFIMNPLSEFNNVTSENEIILSNYFSTVNDSTIIAYTFIMIGIMIMLLLFFSYIVYIMIKCGMLVKFRYLVLKGECLEPKIEKSRLFIIILGLMELIAAVLIYKIFIHFIIDILMAMIPITLYSLLICFLSMHFEIEE